MEISKKCLGDGCGKYESFATCGGWSLKHDEYYYCDECYKKFSDKILKKYEEVANEKIKKMFPNGYCVGGNYEGYKKAIIEGIKIGASFHGKEKSK